MMIVIVILLVLAGWVGQRAHEHLLLGRVERMLDAALDGQPVRAAEIEDKELMQIAYKVARIQKELEAAHDRD